LPPFAAIRRRPIDEQGVLRLMAHAMNLGFLPGSLPLHSSELEFRQLPEPEPPAACGDGTLTSTKRRRVLIVDDNLDSTEGLKLLFGQWGHEVWVAHDGLAAVQAATEFRPQVVILDIGLPKLDGYQAARRIRAELGDSVLLVAMSGWGQAEDRRRAQEAGFNHHLTKPVEPRVLHQLLAGAAP
jgi:CheY-like chemotaxis protein